MYKKILSMALSIMLLLSCFTITVMADTASADVKSELELTANAVLNSIKGNLASESYTVSYEDIKNYALVLKAGVSDEAVTNSLLTFIKDTFNEDGTTNGLTGTFYPNTWYAYTILLLNELDYNSSDFNGVDFNSLLETSYNNEATNIYCEQYVAAAVNHNPDAFSNPNGILEKAKNAILDSYVSDANGVGIDYWGVSADNNGQCLIVLKPVYSTDESIKTKVDNALIWITEQLSAENAVIYYGNPNPNSTALALKAFAEFGDFTNGSKLFEGLKTFKSNTTPGVYTYGGEDSLFTTYDALIGLLAYYRAIEGYNTFDVIEAEIIEPTTDITGETATTTEDVNNTATPPTGDYTPIILLAGILAVSGLLYAGAKISKAS